MLIFRFTAGLILILLVSMIGIKLEKDELALKRTISLQHYRMDQLLEERSRLRIRIHELTGPSVRMADQTFDETDL
ncbi:MAG: hypothetical protein R3C02_16370 [Planctomycetaceae bacterium]